MSAAVDHFTSFVDALAEALDDHEVTSADLAARLHLSRFHLDRIVASVAGESPRRFRRRILLERSAYRLLTTRRTILDVAVEAGYGSHEAFTRAFTKAYGIGPSQWRARPTSIRVEAPSDVHFHPPGSLRLPAEKKVTPMDLLTRMVEHHIWLTSEMIRCAERLSDAQLDEPIELSVDDDRQTIRTLLSRLVGLCARASESSGHRLRRVPTGSSLAATHTAPRTARGRARVAREGGAHSGHLVHCKRQPRSRQGERGG